MFPTNKIENNNFIFTLFLKYSNNKPNPEKVQIAIAGLFGFIFGLQKKVSEEILKYCFVLLQIKYYFYIIF